MQPGLSDYAIESGNLGGENAASQRAEPVITPTRILVIEPPADLLHHSLFHQPLQVVVQGARPKPVAPLRLPSDLLHDAVAMQIFTGERKQNVQHGRSQREEVVNLHNRIPLYQKPIVESRIEVV